MRIITELSISDWRQILRKQWSSRYYKLPCETGKMAH